MPGQSFWQDFSSALNVTGIKMAAAPGDASGFDCFAVNVTGEGIASLDKGHDFNDSSDTANCTYPGVISDFFPSGGGSVELEVPSGSDRLIQVIGFDMPGSCQIGENAYSGSEDSSGETMYVVGSARSDLFGDTSIGIANTYESGVTSEFCAGSSSGLNLVVPVEMADYGLGNFAAGDHIFEISETSLDTGHFDGASYSFEIVGENSDPGDANVYLVNSSGTIISTITIPGNTTAVTRFDGGSFSPTSGLDTYRVKLEGTGANDEVKVYSARMMVKQINATKTALFVPLVSSQHNSTSTVDGGSTNTDNTNSSTYAQGSNEEAYLLWKFTASLFDRIDAFKFEAVIEAVGNTAYAILYDFSADSEVSDSEVSTVNTSPTFLSSDFTSGMTDGNLYELRIKNTGGAATRLHRGGLWILLSNLKKARTYFRVGKADSVGVAGDQEEPEARHHIVKSDFSNPSLFLETTRWEKVGGGDITDHNIDVHEIDSDFSIAETSVYLGPSGDITTSDRIASSWFLGVGGVALKNESSYYVKYSRDSGNLMVGATFMAIDVK